MARDCGGAQPSNISGMIFMGTPSDGAGSINFGGNICLSDTVNQGSTNSFNGTRYSSITVDRVQFLESEGNVNAGGRMTVWGIAHA